jgi:N-acetylmuramoyl-L-alanine amidase
MKRRWATWVCTAAALISIGTATVHTRAEAFTARNLAYGSVGYDVNELQSRLRLLGYYWGKIDGIFGWKTYWAVRTFQYNFGMKATGFVDLKTKMKLVAATPNWHYRREQSARTRRSAQVRGANWSTVPSVVNGITQQDIRLMAHVVYGEARGEPYVGQVAIAAVILNRLQDPRFPHTIPAIIYQPGAFTCVQDGQINLQPDNEAVKAVLDALHGWDPSYGAVYYFNPATATSPWVWSRPQLTRIGKHIFCR